MGVNVYRSTDRGAPALSGGVGGALSALNAALYTGFPTASVTSITRSGSTATVSHTAHGFINGQEVSVTGAAETEYNVRVKITYIDANSYSYPVSGTPATPATGTILVGGEKTVGTVTLTRSGSTVTATCTGHGFTAGQRVRIQGATEHQYNGLWKIATVPDANTFTYSVWSDYTPNSPATGTIICRYGVCGAGWTLDYSGTNKRAWKQGVRGSLSRMYLRANQSDTDYHAKCIHMTMVESMTGIDTVTNPGTALSSINLNGQWISGSNDSTARNYVFAADERTIIMMFKPEETGSFYAQTGWSLSYMGDICDFAPDNAYPQIDGCGLSLGATGYTLYNNPTVLYLLATAANGTHGLQERLYNAGGYQDYAAWRMIRNHAEASGVSAAWISDPVGYKYALAGQYFQPEANHSLGRYTSNNNTFTYAAQEYPDPVHGGMSMSRPVVTHAHSAPHQNTGPDVVRGELLAVWSPHHNHQLLSSAGFASGDLFRGSGKLSGKLFEYFVLNGHDTVSTYQIPGCLVLEISDTWRD